MATYSYSPLFTTLYDEPEPVGQLGRGAHYSVLKAIQWKDIRREALVLPLMQTFAVLWDEDHDERVISVIESAYLNDLLSPVLFIGERKASLTVVVHDDYALGAEHKLSKFQEAWQVACSSTLLDYWDVEVVRFSVAAKAQIINDRQEKVATYLHNICNLWPLGLKRHKSQLYSEQDIDDSLFGTSASK